MRSRTRNSSKPNQNKKNILMINPRARKAARIMKEAKMITPEIARLGKMTMRGWSKQNLLKVI